MKREDLLNFIYIFGFDKKLLPFGEANPFAKVP